MTYCPDNASESETGRRIEVTEEMVAAGYAAVRRSTAVDDVYDPEPWPAMREMLADVFRSMLAASR